MVATVAIDGSSGRRPNPFVPRGVTAGMDFTGDELAGVVDLFGALTRAELGQALVELAFKQGEDATPEDFDDGIDAAVERYHLVAVDREDDELLVPGPMAFPELPENAQDLPHIMDVETRSVDRADLADDVEQRFRGETATAVADGDTERMEQLLDASYELEVWGPVDLAGARDRLDDALE
jgi:hypothetical protein